MSGLTASQFISRAEIDDAYDKLHAENESLKKDKVIISKQLFDGMVEYIVHRTNCSGGWWNDSWTYDLIGKIEREVKREVVRHF